jgi:inorganic pyrophosphatase
MKLTELPAGPQPPQIVLAVIEIPRGSQNKYEYDVNLELFRLERVLYSAVHYPAAYGFIPSTLAGDGDAVDILVMMSNEAFTGCIVDARPVGLFRMRDEKGDDEKVLAVPTVDPRYADIHELDDVPSHFLDEVEHFFRVYKDLEGTRVETFGWEPRAVAEDYIASALLKRG